MTIATKLLFLIHLKEVTQTYHQLTAMIHVSYSGWSTSAPANSRSLATLGPSSKLSAHLHLAPPSLGLYLRSEEHSIPSLPSR